MRVVVFGIGDMEPVQAAVLAEMDHQVTCMDVDNKVACLKERAAVADCLPPNHIIIGTDSDHAMSLKGERHAPFNHNRYDPTLLQRVTYYAIGRGNSLEHMHTLEQA